MAEENTVNATPGAIAHAEEHGVDLTKVEGSGEEGKVTKGDVQKHIDSVAGSDEKKGDESTTPAAPAAKKKDEDPEARARWDAHLARAEQFAKENGTIHIFEAQKANGEFDTIPDSFKSAPAA